ncbi:MAG: DUF3604 domain-containing protein, partial [Rhizobiales bacterium]|nr:DUF3604 domain-containing protein [Hyphomicrobiales bacterium]
MRSGATGAGVVKLGSMRESGAIGYATPALSRSCRWMKPTGLPPRTAKRPFFLRAWRRPSASAANASGRIVSGPDVMIAAAEQNNHPGQFTAFIAFEWTAAPGGANLHRNVIFRDGKDKADQIVPFSQYDSIDAEDLWQWMADYEQKTGGRLLAIPARSLVYAR